MPAVKPVFPTVQRAHPLAQGLIATWIFAEGSGSTVFDVSGRQNHGTLTNMAESSSTSGWWKSQHGYTLAFDGSDDKVVVGDIALFDFVDTRFSLVVGTKQSNTAANAYIVAKRTTTGSAGYFIRTNATGNVVIRTHSTLDISAERTSTSTSIYDGNMHQIVAVFRTDTATLGNNDAQLYIDGKLDQGSLTSNAVYESPTGQALTFGVASDDVGPVSGFIDYVYMYNRQLSSLEVAMLYHNPFSVVTPLSSIYNVFPSSLFVQQARRLLMGVG